jgi:hypothetical protein
MAMFDPKDLYEDPDLSADAEEGGDGGDDGSGSTGGSGFNEPILDMAIFGLVQAKIREGERKYGAIPDPKDPYTEDQGMRKGKRLRAHPLLSKAAEFSGIDKKMNPNPKENAEAEKRYAELQLEYALRAQLTHSKQQRLTISAPSLRRT